MNMYNKFSEMLCKHFIKTLVKTNKGFVENFETSDVKLSEIWQLFISISIIVQ